MAIKPRLVILDAHALLHRAWHALPPLTSPDGMVVNAVYGVMMVMMKVLQDVKPDSLVACWDTAAPTFRHEAYKEYKAQREEQPDELYAQIPLLQDGLRLLGIPSVEKDGFEADDLIGTIAIRSKKQGWEVTILTSDRDALQLVQPDISVLAFKKGVSETIMFDEQEIQKQYGLTPKQFIEYKAMRGDPSDNIPGIRGIGEKGATDLLTTYSDLKTIFRAAHDAASSMPAGIRAKLLTAEQQMPAILDLVRIKIDAPVDWRPTKGSAITRDEPALRAFFLKLGFKSLVAKLATKQTGDSNGRPASFHHHPAKKNQESKERLTNVAEAKNALEQLRISNEIVVRVSREQAGTLFAGSVDGIVLGTDNHCWLLATDVLKHKIIASGIQSLFDDPTIGKIAHDAKKELTLLESLGFSVRSWSFDVMLAAYLLSAGERNHDLASVTSQRTEMILASDALTVLEAQAITKLTPLLRAELIETQALTILNLFELPLIPILRSMERRGIRINPTYFMTLSQEMRLHKTTMETRMMKAAGREFNPASPSQLAEVLFSDLHLPTKGIKKGKTGFSTAAPELEKLRGSHPMIEMIEEHRELAKLLSTYVDVLPTLADKQQRVHTTFNQAVAATGRLSSSDPNLQNIPIKSELGRKIRRGFVASDGMMLLSCDYSQIELRIVAALAHDEKMLEAFRHGDDIHTATASAIWKITKTQVTKDQRRAAKAINFGIIYGQGPMGLAASAGIPFAEAKQFIATYFDVYRGIKRFLDETKARAMKLGYVETLFGRRRPLPEIHSPLPQLRAQAERMAINMPAQGTSADIMKLAMIAVDAKLSTISADSHLLLQVHDELLLEVPHQDVNRVAAFVVDIMENVEKIGVPIVVEAQQGKNWEEMVPLSSSQT